VRCCVWPREAAGGANVRAGVTASGYLVEVVVWRGLAVIARAGERIGNARCVVEKSCRKSAGDIVSVLAGAGLWTEMCRVRVVNVVLGLCISMLSLLSKWHAENDLACPCTRSL
jgi:hypothetical protein